MKYCGTVDGKWYMFKRGRLLTDEEAAAMIWGQGEEVDSTEVFLLPDNMGVIFESQDEACVEITQAAP